MSCSIKTEFKSKKLQGMNSFKVVSCSRKLNSLIHKLNKECIQRLDCGIKEGNQTGITVAVESPK